MRQTQRNEFSDKVSLDLNLLLRWSIRSFTTGKTKKYKQLLKYCYHRYKNSLITTRLMVNSKDCMSVKFTQTQFMLAWCQRVGLHQSSCSTLKPVTMCFLLDYGQENYWSIQPSVSLVCLAGVEARCVHLCRVALCDPIWQVTLRSSGIGSHRATHTFFFKALLDQDTVETLHKLIN